MIVTVAVSALWVSLLSLMGSIICRNIRERQHDLTMGEIRKWVRT